MSNKNKYYAVYKGPVFEIWEDCKNEITGNFRKYKSFYNYQDAFYFSQNGIEPSIEIPENEIYTDGACDGHNAGIGVFWGDNHPWNCSEPFYDRPITNQRAEIAAIIRACEILDENNVEKTKEYKLFTDSYYAYMIITSWFEKWKENNWQTIAGTPVKNKDLIKKMVEKVRSRKVQIFHVYGHLGNPGNDRADKLAVAGKKMAMKERSKK